MSRIVILAAIAVSIASIISIALGGAYAAAGWATVLVGAVCIALYLANLYDKECARQEVQDYLDKVLYQTTNVYRR